MRITTRTNVTPGWSSEARGVIRLLGFAGYRDLALKARVASPTVSHMFYMPRHGVQFPRVAMVQSSLREAYLSRRDAMTIAQRRYVCDFMNRWLMELAGYVMPVRKRDAQSRSKVYRTRARAARMAALKAWRWRP